MPSSVFPNNAYVLMFLFNVLLLLLGTFLDITPIADLHADFPSIASAGNLAGAFRHHHRLNCASASQHTAGQQRCSSRRGSPRSRSAS